MRSLFVTVVLALAVPAALAGQYSAEVETAASKIFHTTMSPFCPGRTLTTCPSSQAAELKDEIRRRLGRMRTAAGTGVARPAEMGLESRQRVQDELARL
ncbi:MAG: hypothetical protein IH965_04505 [Gemmatimonadetes bacterium]|nr:hypothetical protein [Gemmatimonadota bacterium]